MAKFTVDTHLFRELGELLVGRDSTALIELIKNAYDADAKEVTVHGEMLDLPGQGRIMIVDDGTGMHAAEFEQGFLRVASRLKEEGERRSTLFRRRYTGAKGIGRLAAHKLARKLEITSRRRISQGTRMQQTLYAAIDWDEIERYETLDDLDSTEAILMESKEMGATDRSGTTLVLSRLRRAWTPTERARFFAEVQSFDAPAFLRKPLPQSIVEEPLLFSSPVVRDQHGPRDALESSFQVKLEGEFAAGEGYWGLVAGIASWVLEIQAVPGNERVRMAIAPTKKTRDENPSAGGVEELIPHPDPERGPYFDARILVREGRFTGSRDQRTWASHASGVRVYLEGFRVLPYGEPKDDWLSIDADYTRRPRQFEILQEFGLEMEDSDRDAGPCSFAEQQLLRSDISRPGTLPYASDPRKSRRICSGSGVRYAGAVGKDGYRLVYAGTRGSGEGTPSKVEGRAPVRNRAQTRITDQNSKPDEYPEHLVLPERLDEAVQLMKSARAQLSAGGTGDANEMVVAALEKVSAAEDLATELMSERALLHVLASVGTQMAAFVHEINALLGAAQTVEQALERLLEENGLSSGQRRTMRQTLGIVTDLKRGLERQGPPISWTSRSPMLAVAVRVSVSRNGSTPQFVWFSTKRSDWVSKLKITSHPR